MFIALGGFISMITRLTNFVIRGYQGYSIDKSLIKKVFSVRKKRSKQERAQTEAQMKQSFSNADTYQHKLMEAI